MKSASFADNGHLERHHVFGAANRKHSERWGLVGKNFALLVIVQVSGRCISAGKQRTR